MGRFGITRVGELTGLDTLGVPVWFAARPNSFSLSVAQGKGLDDRQACLSAVFEAIESAAAERVVEAASGMASIAELRRRGIRTVPFAQMRRCRPAVLDPDLPRLWVAGYSMRDGKQVLAPAELVGLDFRPEAGWDREAFQQSSEGLAAGFELEAARCHALLELVENAATALLDAFGPAGRFLRRLESKSLHSTELHKLIGRLQRAGCEPWFYSVPNAFDVPVVMATIERVIAGPAGPAGVIHAGQACRATAEAAAIAALLEAVQSRLTDIAGSREDIDHGVYLGATASCDLRAGVAPPPEPCSAAATFSGLCAHLFERGVADVFVFDLPVNDKSVNAVRLLGAGLSGANGQLHVLDENEIAAFMTGTAEAGP